MFEIISFIILLLVGIIFGSNIRSQYSKEIFLDENGKKSVVQLLKYVEYKTGYSLSIDKNDVVIASNEKNQIKFYLDNYLSNMLNDDVGLMEENLNGFIYNIRKELDGESFANVCEILSE